MAKISEKSRSRTNSFPPPGATSNGSGASQASDDPPEYPGHEAAANLSVSMHGSTSKLPIPGYSHLPLNLYHIPTATLSYDKTTQTTYDPTLSTSPQALESFLAEQLKLPPRPTIRIVGRIQGGGPVPVFDVRCDLFRHVNPSEERGGLLAYSKVSGMDEAGLGAGSAPISVSEKSALFSGQPDVTGAGFWLRRFCADSSPVKKFIFKRQVTNWDTSYLFAEIKKLIHNMGFRGHVDVSFPLQHSCIVIHSPHQVNSVLTSLRNVFVSPKTFEVLTSYWPYASAPRSPSDSMLNQKQRECVLQSEEEWFEEWRDAIQLAIAARRQGWVCTEDKVEAAMSGPGQQGFNGASQPLAGGVRLQ